MCSMSTAVMSASSRRFRRSAHRSCDAATTFWCETAVSAWQPNRCLVRPYRRTTLTGGGAMDVHVVRPGCAIALSGRLGAATVADVRAALSDAVDSGVGDLLVDLQGVELVDATGL